MEADLRTVVAAMGVVIGFAVLMNSERGSEVLGAARDVLALSTDPCALPAATRRFDQLQRAGETRAALDLAAAFRAEYAPHEGLQAREYALGMAAGDADAAVGAANAAVARAPRSPAAYVQRAAARQAQGDTAGAVQDSRTAYSLDPDHGADQARSLALALDRAELPCAAMEAWSMLGDLDRGHRREALRAQVALGLRCRGWEARGGDEIQSTDLGRGIALPVSLGADTFLFGLDPGSLWTSVTPDLAAELGLRLEADPILTLSQGESVQAQVAMIGVLSLGSFHLRGVTVLVVPTLPDGLRGVLGENVLARAELTQVGRRRWKIQAR